MRLSGLGLSVVVLGAALGSAGCQSEWFDTRVSTPVANITHVHQTEDVDRLFGLMPLIGGGLLGGFGYWMTGADKPFWKGIGWIFFVLGTLEFGIGTGMTFANAFRAPRDYDGPP